MYTWTDKTFIQRPDKDLNDTTVTKAILLV